MKSALCRCLLLILLFSISKLAHATFPDITGNYAGTINGLDSGPPAECDNGPFTGTLQLELNGSTNGQFTGNGSFVDSFGEASGLVNIQGTNGTNTFSATFNTEEGATGATLTGTFTESSITVTNGSGGPDADGCFFSNLAGTLNKISGTVASPATASSC